MSHTGGISGSRASTKPCSTVSALTGFDPGRSAVNDEQGHCVACGRDNSNYEGAPCADDCPMYGWYERRHELEPGQVFRDYEGCLVKLDRGVPGDATKWYVATWYGSSWAYEDATIEPGDLRERVADPQVPA
jgi:hypothetical protein